MRKAISAAAAISLLAGSAQAAELRLYIGKKELKKSILEQYSKYALSKPLEEIIETAGISSKIEIPDYLAEQANWNIHVSRDEACIRVFQDHGQAYHLVMESEAVTGGLHMDHHLGRLRDFETPSGHYYITRVVKDPLYYHPGWSKKAGQVEQPGRANPYGRVMFELCTKPAKANYGFNPPFDSTINMHSTPRFRLSDKSHGCIRGEPKKMEELGDAIIKNYSDGSFQKNSRGTIFILDRAIPVYVR